MELVIKLSEEDYEIMKHNIAVGNPLCPLSQEEMVSKVANGTPLPKGHGRLVNADIIKDIKNKIKHYRKDYTFTQEEILNILERYEIKHAPTIIEADKAEGEK